MRVALTKWSLLVLLACWVCVLSPPASNFRAQAQVSDAFFDHFLGPALDPRWTALANAAGAVNVTDSFAELSSPAAADASALLYGARLDKTRSQLWVFAVSNHSGNFPQWWLTLVDSAQAPVADTLASYAPKLRARVSAALSGATRGIQFEHWDAQHVRRLWNGGSNVWTTSNVLANSPIQANDYYLVGLEFDGPGNRWRMLSWGRRSATAGSFVATQGLKLFALSDWVSWSSLEATSDLWLIVGEPLRDTLNGTLRVEWARQDSGVKTDAWVNSSDGGTYRIKHWHGYASANGAPEFFVPQDRNTVAVDVGSAGSWDSGSFGVKDQYVVQDGSNYYLFYNNNQQIGLATATDPNGPWTKDPANPILTRILGSEENNVVMPGVVKDLSEPDPAQLWKMLYSGFGADAKHRLFLATAPAPHGPWTRHGKVLDIGSVGANDEKGVNRARPVWQNGQWYVFHGVRNAAAFGFWNVSYSTGPDLTQLTKSGQALVPKKLSSLQALTADLAGRTVTVADTSGFEEDGFVGVRKSATEDNSFAVSRVRRVSSPTTLELYHGVDGFLASGPAQIIQADSEAVKDQVAALLQVGPTWYLFITNFGGARGESTGLLTAPDIAGPYSWHKLATPPISLASWGNSNSNENISFATLPVTREPPVPDTDPPVISAVSASSVNATDATIEWLTDEAADSQVEYGVDANYGSLSPLDPQRVLTHSVALSGLLPEATYHFRVISRDAAGNAAVSTDATFTTAAAPPPDATPPGVSFTAPTDGATVSGTGVALAADATDDVGVVGVQFKLDGNNLGPEDLAAPYSFNWDTTAAANGPHTLVVVARDAAGNSAQSSIQIVVDNNYAVQFDGVDDVIVLPAQSPPLQLSLSLWTTAFSLGEGSAAQIFTIRDDADNDPNIQFRLVSGNKLRFLAVYQNGGALDVAYWETPANSVPLNARTHIAVTFDGSSAANDPVIYINGIAQLLTEVDPPVGVLRTQASLWRIGNNASSSATMLGIFDEFRIYARLLAPAEVAAHFNGGVPLRGGPEPGLVAGFHFDELTGTVALDYSGNGLHGTLLNGASRVPY